MPFLENYSEELHFAILDILPNPVLIKNAKLEYVWANAAFLSLFSVTLVELIGKKDTEIFPQRQASQCNSGDLRVLESGEIDEATETVFTETGLERETITRKSKLTLSNGEQLLVGVMHDITDVITANRALEQATTLLAEKTSELEDLANRDVLTSCYNRRAFIHHANELLGKTGFALLIADLDHFKTINDRYGHSTGDGALRHFAKVAESQIRQEDLMARIGGEEFAFLLPSADKTILHQIGERIRSTFKSTSFMVNGHFVEMSVSLGGVVVNIDQNDLDLVMQQADKSLYISKENGRNSLHIHD